MTDENYNEHEDEALENMPCDNTGYCPGIQCPMFFQCQG